MKWLSSKQGVLAAVLSLLLVVLLAAVTTKNESLVESELSSVSMQTTPLYEFRRKGGEFGFEFEYRTGYTLVPGYERRRLIGNVFVSNGDGRTPLTTFSVSTDTQVRKFSSRTAKYSRYLGVSGYVESSAAEGLVPLVQLEKYNSVRDRSEFLYLEPETDWYKSRIEAGYRFTRRVGYMMPPNEILPIYRWSVYSSKLHEHVNEFRANNEIVPHYTKNKVVGYVFTQWVPGRVGLKEYGSASATSIRRFSTTTSGPFYPNYFGIVGYCVKSKRRANQVPLYEMGEYLFGLSRWDFVYVTNKEDLEHYKNLGYRVTKRLCYIQRP